MARSLRRWRFVALIEVEATEDIPAYVKRSEVWRYAPDVRVSGAKVVKVHHKSARLVVR